MAKATLPPIERFFKYVQKSDDPDGCWLWTGATDSRGYGQLHIGSRPHKAHRISYEHFNGSFAPELDVCHKCDNPLCVNPDHLWLGTARENMLDCGRKGRQHYQRYPERVPRGETHHKAKLSADDVRAIRQRYAVGGITHKALAREYGVARSLISMIIRRECWRHIE